jgi:hypothetical protein
MTASRARSRRPELPLTLIEFSSSRASSGGENRRLAFLDDVFRAAPGRGGFTVSTPPATKVEQHPDRGRVLFDDWLRSSVLEQLLDVGGDDHGSIMSRAMAASSPHQARNELMARA